MDILTYALCKKYTDETVIGGGALKGKNCTVESITPITGGNTVVFKWTLDDGTEQTGSMTVMDGDQGIQGEQGPAGADGAPGQDGADGKDGKDGKDGADGQDGAPGQDGADGVGINTLEVQTISGIPHLIVTYTNAPTTEVDCGAIEVFPQIPSYDGNFQLVCRKNGQTVTYEWENMNPMGIAWEKIWDSDADPIDYTYTVITAGDYIVWGAAGTDGSVTTTGNLVSSYPIQPGTGDTDHARYPYYYFIRCSVGDTITVQQENYYSDYHQGSYSAIFRAGNSQYKKITFVEIINIYCNKETDGTDYFIHTEGINQELWLHCCIGNSRDSTLTDSPEATQKIQTQWRSSAAYTKFLASTLHFYGVGRAGGASSLIGLRIHQE